MLANDAAAKAVLTPTAAAAARDGFHANMASVSPECGTILHGIFTAAGASYVSSPVLGRPAVAAAGELNILVAGDEAAAAGAQPFFDLMGKKTWPLGTNPSQANIAKVAVNLNIIHAIQVVYSGYGRMIAQSSYLPQGFSLELGLKDLTLAAGIASSQGNSLATSDALASVFETALSRPELAELDWAALAEVARSAPETPTTA
jgi:3-hydroxyisobutyrate dehydrogenase-like beta-hydroxyacid dehydrogenase